MRLLARSSALALLGLCLGAGFFSNPEHLAQLAFWESSDIGAVWSDNFDRASLGANWFPTLDVNASIATNQLMFNQTNLSANRVMRYVPWVTSSDQYTIRWTERFGTLDSNSVGVGVGIYNFQPFGGDDRAYNALLVGTGPDFGKIKLQRFDGTTNQVLVAAGNAMALTVGNVIDCSFTRSAWTFTVTASNRANAQVSTASILCSETPYIPLPTISRVCFYPFRGAVYVDDLSFTINHRKPARFIVIGASACEGFNATTVAQRFINVVQSNYVETVCNDSSSYNVTSDSLYLLPEIFQHQPKTAILMIGGNDIFFEVPTATWQSNYAYLTMQLQTNGVQVKHCLPTPRNTADLTPLKTYIATHYPAKDVIDTWTPLLTNASSLNPIYDSGDHVHPNDAGHLLIGLIIRTNLP